MKIKTNRRFTISAAALTVAVSVGISGCSGAPASLQQASPSGSDSSLSNCGFNLSLDTVPERVVTLKSTPLEMLLALGESDRIVGSAMLDGPVPAELTPSGWEPTVLADEAPSKEVFLAAQPDFVFAGWESSLSADGVGTRDELHQLGIRSYVAPPACSFGGDAPEELEFDDVFDMILEVGTIFEAEDRAQALIDGQRERLAAVDRPSAEVSALWFSSGEDVPFVGGGTGSPNMIMRAAGLSNTAGAEAQSWFSMPWESFVASDPDVIVLVDAPWNSAEKKQALLESHPAASTMRAVRDARFIVVDFATTEAGVRNIDAVETIAKAAQRL